MAKERDEMTLIECNKFMLENQINSDVTFIVGKDRKPIKAHKYVLGSRNSVFNAMLFGSLAEKREIIIPDIEPSVFCSLLKFFYTDQIEVKGNNVCALMYACNKYNAKGAMKKCTDFLTTSINSKNVCQVLENALLYNEVNLKEKCMSLIFRSASDILKSKQFTQLTKDSLKIIIESDNLVVDESLIYKSVIAWAEGECERQQLDVSDDNIKALVQEMIYLVRFPLMSAQYFADNVATRRILTDEDKVDIFMYINGSKKAICNEKIITKSRKVVLKYVYRLSSSVTRPAWNVGFVDSIVFSVSEDIFLHGVILYGCANRDAEYLICCKLHDGVFLLSEVKKNITSVSECEFLNIMLPNPVKLKSQTNYTLVALMNGSPTRRGQDGTGVSVAHGVKFRFKESDRNGDGSTVKYGQLPGLIFTL